MYFKMIQILELVEKNFKIVIRSLFRVFKECWIIKELYFRKEMEIIKRMKWNIQNRKIYYLK